MPVAGGVAVLLIATSTQPSQPSPSADDLMRASRRLYATPCGGTGAVGDIVVCGRGEADRQRVPPTPRAPERAPAAALSREMDNAFAAPGGRLECGSFMGQQRCSKADMARSGWGGGRDPVTAARRIVEGADAVPDPIELDGRDPRQ